MIRKTILSMALLALTSSLVSATSVPVYKCEKKFCARLTRMTRDLEFPSFYNGFGQFGDRCFCKGEAFETAEYTCQKLKYSFDELVKENMANETDRSNYWRPGETGTWQCQRKAKSPKGKHPRHKCKGKTSKGKTSKGQLPTGKSSKQGPKQIAPKKKCEEEFCHKLTRLTYDIVYPDFYNGYGQPGDKCFCKDNDYEILCNKGQEIMPQNSLGSRKLIKTIPFEEWRKDETGDWTCKRFAHSSVKPAAPTHRDPKGKP